MKEYRKGVHDGSTILTDRRLLSEAYIEVYRYHPYISRIMLERMHFIGWTHSEILEGRLEQGIFFPNVKYWESRQLEVQGFQLHILESKTQWKRVLINWIKKNKPQLLGNQQKNNSQKGVDFRQ